MSYYGSDYSDNLMPGTSVADIDREAYGCYGPEEDEFWCIGCMLELPVGPPGVPEDEFCEECRAEIGGAHVMTRIDVEALRLAHLAALVIERGTYDAYRRARLAAAHAPMALGRTYLDTPERLQARADLHVAGLAEHIAYAGYLQAACERHEAYVAWMDASVELFEQSHSRRQRTLPRVTALRLTA